MFNKFTKRKYSRGSVLFFVEQVNFSFREICAGFDKLSFITNQAAAMGRGAFNRAKIYAANNPSSTVFGLERGVRLVVISGGNLKGLLEDAIDVTTTGG